ncbi:Ankyrin repeats (3 copies) [Legionella steelei]|uniref:Ankyrin repeats (3 copies) n=1 Tax=Legionella steelei TaxID=947033 RepID=A0A0W0ZCN4_9GAMM|nr:ankyrin repeat domain-containing protein [Legionella steelei]KTD66944.1 Ankyrin repeats (3 copies) [Legionella steelei]
MKRYYFNNSKNYIDSHEPLSKEQIEQLNEIMSFFPHHSKESWPELLMSFQPEKYSPKLVHMAANAFDHNGYSMLGLACEYGKDVGIVQRLVDLGANPNKPDHMRKLPLHHAINNQLSRSNRDSLDAVAVVQCLLNNGANTQNTSFQNRTPLSFAQSQHFKAAAKIIKEHTGFSRSYGIFQKSLLTGNTYSLKRMLDGSATLASSITTLKGWSSVFTAVHQSYAHRNTLNSLELLKKHHVDFNSTHYLTTYSGMPVYCAVNPIAYFLLRGGDSRLIDALIKHGADPEHYSVAVVKKIIELHPKNKAFDYVVQNDNNPFDVNARTLLTLFEAKTMKQDVSISDEDMARSAFGTGSFTAQFR